MKEVVEIEVKKHYGADLFYPVSKFAKFLCDIKEKPCLKINDLQLCLDAGYEVVQKAPRCEQLENLGIGKK